MKITLNLFLYLMQDKLVMNKNKLFLNEVTNIKQIKKHKCLKNFIILIKIFMKIKIIM